MIVGANIILKSIIQSCAIEWIVWVNFYKCFSHCWPTVPLTDASQMLHNAVTLSTHRTVASLWAHCETTPSKVSVKTQIFLQSSLPNTNNSVLHNLTTTNYSKTNCLQYTHNPPWLLINSRTCQSSFPTSSSRLSLSLRQSRGLRGLGELACAILRVGPGWWGEGLWWLSSGWWWVKVRLFCLTLCRSISPVWSSAAI
jgi:hypothetical protein